MRPGSPSKIGLILLAAGSSSRLGQAKQLLPYKGESLIRHAALAAIDADFKPIVVVLGAEADATKKELQNLAVIQVVNSHWEKGLASSIKKGLQEILLLEPELDGLVLMVCDQPYVNANLLRKLKKAWLETGKGLAACTYAGTVGTPALIARDYFPEIEALQGQEGAKKLLLAYKTFLALVPFPMGKVDIDTPEDLKNLEI